MDYSCILFGIIFTVTGFLFALGKVHKRLSAWKSMPEDEKKKIKIKALCRNIGEIIMLNGIIFLLKGFWVEFSNRWFIAAMIAWLIVAGFDVWHISKSGRYQSE